MKKIITTLLVIAIVAVCAVSMLACGSTTPTIGVQTGTTGYFYANGDVDWGFDGFENIDVKQYDNGALAVKDMLNGNIDYVIIDEAPASALVDSNKGTKLIDIKLTEEEYAFGVDPAQPELLTKVNQVLATMMENGEFDKIMNNYFGDGTPVVVESAVKDETKADKQFVISTNAAFAPFEYTDGNGFAGIDIEIAAYIAKALDMELVVDDMAFEAVVSSVGKNGVDVAMSGLTVNEERKAMVTFSNSYYQASQMIIVPADDTAFDACKTAADVEAVLKSLK